MKNEKSRGEREEEFKSRLIEYLSKFKDCPNMLADYLCNNDAFKNSFKSKLMKSSILNRESNNMRLGYHEITNDQAAKETLDKVNPRVFTSLDEMLDHYDEMLESHNAEDLKHLPAAQKEDVIAMYYAQLDIALEKEKYKEAAKLRDFIRILENN
jgi:hypothetical protein